MPTSQRESIEPFSLREQVALVTGAAGGVGRGIVRVLAAAGAHIVVFDNDEQPAREVAGAAATFGGQGVAIVGDVASPTDVKQAVERTLNIFNRLDILVNNAAIVNRVDGVNTILEQDLESWQRVMAVNLFGAFLCIKEALPAMIARQYGRIVNISSRLTRTGGYSLGAAYGASKAGLDYLTKATAVQGAQYGVTCNGVSPYAVDAGMALTAPVDRESVIQGIPVRRYCSPEEIGHAVLYFASPAAGFVTGQTLHINGGALMIG